MSEQKFSNHSRYIPLWHFVIPLLIVSVLTGSIINFFRSDNHNRYSAALIVVMTIVLIGFYWYARWFALRAQDRAIRAEESLRYYIITGKPLDKRLRMGQIIALRFASDEELPALVKQAVDEKLSPKNIKLAIKNWKPDYNRV